MCVMYFGSLFLFSREYNDLLEREGFIRFLFWRKWSFWRIKHLHLLVHQLEHPLVLLSSFQL